MYQPMEEVQDLKAKGKDQMTTSMGMNTDEEGRPECTCTASVLGLSCTSWLI